MAFSNSGHSWLLIVPLIPSILVTIFVLYHLLINQALRTALNNHVIILLLSSGLILELTDILWHIYYYYNGTVLSATPAFCLIWSFFCSAGIVICYILMAWASVERHILIFYPHWFATKIKRFFLHYLPLVACILYPTIFYLIIFFVVPCNIPFNYGKRLCSRYGCVVRISWVALWDSFAHNILPAFITVISSVALLVRVLYRRYRIRGRIDWRNYKKMAGQLLLISILYILLQLPPMFLYAAYSFGVSRNVATDYFYDALYFAYWAIMFTPFASAVSLPDLPTKCRNGILFWRRDRVIGTQIFVMSHSRVGQAPTTLPPVQ